MSGEDTTRIAIAAEVTEAWPAPRLGRALKFDVRINRSIDSSTARSMFVPMLTSRLPTAKSETMLSILTNFLKS